MRRQDLQLLALAKQGDAAAGCEVGRRYLTGADGFPHHVPTGLAYLNHANVRELPQAARVIAENLALEDLLQLGQDKALADAAASGSVVAQARFGAWLCLRQTRIDEAARWLRAAANAGHEGARRAVAALVPAAGDDAHIDVLRALGAGDGFDAPQVALLAARRALAERDSACLAAALRASLALTSGVSAELAELIAAAVRIAEEADAPSIGLPAQAVETALDMRASRGDRDAAYALGRALCGIACGALAPEALAGGSNMRKGAALLLRAADAGREQAWLHLYRLHGDHNLSVANPQMARFCLEKAALGGQIEAQRKLGALLLRAADSLADSEQAIEWLHQAAAAQDVHARGLMKSLVLPLAGSDADAAAAIELVRQDDPWLAMRLQLSRQFGLTKLEALSVDPAEGLRPWGLVVGKNPFIAQIRLSAARAIPALTDAAMQVLQRAASFFGRSGRDAAAFEGDLRRRSLRQRRAFERHGLDEAMFFATASSTTLETLRSGPKWAFRVKKPLQLALAA